MLSKSVQHQNGKIRERSFDCTMCQKHFFLESYYIFHVRSHLNDNNLLCHVCGKRFSKIYYFQKHLSVHDLKKSQQECGGMKPLQDTSEKPIQVLRHDSSGILIQCFSNADETSPVACRPENPVVPVHKDMKALVSSASDISIKNTAVRDVNKQSSSQLSIHRTEAPLTLNQCQNSSASNVRPVEKISDGFSCNSCKMSYYYEAHLKQHICPPVKRNLPRGQSKKSNATLNRATTRSSSVTSEKIPSSEQSAETSHPLGFRLLRHKNGRTRFSCNACKKLHYSRDQFERHVCEGPVKETYACHLCTKVFDRLGLFNQHIFTHTKPFVCKVCGKAFGSQCALTYHIRAHTGHKPFACDVCKKSFANRRYLATHRLVHTGVKPHECPVCGKKFTLKSVAAVHYRVHTGERPYSCILCPKTFSNSSSLTRHKRWHTGEKPYSCEVCQKQFSEKKILTQHMRKHETE